MGQAAVDNDEFNLIIFDTSFPQQSPDSWRRLNIAPAYHHPYVRNHRAWGVRIHTDSEGSRNGGSCDGPLIADSTQSVVVIVLRPHDYGEFPSGETVLVVRVAALVRYMSSARSGEHIPWDAWKRDAIVAENPHHNVSYIRISVHGTRVLFVTHDWRGGYRFQAYDFSRWGCRALVRVGDGEMERMVMPNPEKVWFPTMPNNRLENMRTLGNSLVVCTVSNSLNTLRRDELTTCERRIQLPIAIYTSGS